MNFPHIEYLKTGDQNWGWNGSGWYFWDETQAYCHGPYESQEKARQQLNKYVAYLDNENEEYFRLN
jgi:hypothetical protein